ncbi:MAG: hypothetical protein GY936_14595 [Ignavibacteriae bacterium]|nr:hypothetical protein [Ignavibacteriota bacterium]
MTTIQYLIPNVQTLHATSVQLKVYDVLGREVATLVNEGKLPGNYQLLFDGSKLTSGINFYSIKVGNEFVEQKRCYCLNRNPNYKNI